MSHSLNDTSLDDSLLDKLDEESLSSIGVFYFFETLLNVLFFMFSLSALTLIVGLFFVISFSFILIFFINFYHSSIFFKTFSSALLEVSSSDDEDFFFFFTFSIFFNSSFMSEESEELEVSSSFPCVP